MREFRADAIPVPRWTGPKLTGEHGPLDLEIGAGQGLHGIRYCQQNPERTLIAIERTANRFAALKNRLDHHPDIRNMIAVRADAVPFVTHFVADHSLENVFLLYPNPYPKHKQSNQRWHYHPFLDELRRKMKPNARLHLATNLEWYAQEAKEQMVNRSFRLVSENRITQMDRPRTHFERKYLQSGQPVYDLVFERMGNS